MLLGMIIKYSTFSLEYGFESRIRATVTLITIKYFDSSFSSVRLRSCLALGSSVPRQF